MLVVARDLASFLIGGGGLIYQALQEKPDSAVLMVFAGLLITPGAFATHFLARSGTGGQSSPPPSQQPPSSPSSPSSPG